MDTWEERGSEFESLDKSPLLSSAPASSSSGSTLGWDLKFRRTKNPARVAERKMRMILRGHIRFVSLCLSLQSLRFSERESFNIIREERGNDEMKKASWGGKWTLVLFLSKG